MKQYRVLIVDDHPLARQGIRAVLEADSSFLIVGEATDGREAYEFCTNLQPDLILMDITMPYCNGLEATRMIKKSYPHIKVVMISVSEDVADLFQAVQVGAQGYLLKNLEPEDWVQYLHALLGENLDISREMANRMFLRFHQELVIDEPNPTILTSREQEILLRVAKGDTNKQISTHLFIAENTVKNHIKNILEKLQLQNRVQLASYAVRHGFTDEN